MLDREDDLAVVALDADAIAPIVHPFDDRRGLAVELRLRLEVLDHHELGREDAGAGGDARSAH